MHEAEQPTEKRAFYSGFVDFTDRHWKPLTFVGIIILILSAGVLAMNLVNTGSFMERDFELTGGKQIEIALNGTHDINVVRAALPGALVSIVSGLQQNLLVETDVTANETEIFATLNSLGISGSHSIRTIGPVLGELFWRQTQIAIIAAFILMSVVVFILFRTFTPSATIVFCAITDAAFALAVLSLFGTQLSMAVLAGTLMLIGYSVDTDIVLTTEVLRGSRKDVSRHIRTAAKTGLTLTIAALAALGTMYMISGSIVIREIALVLIIGLLADIPTTWLTNGGILRWYIERKERKAATIE